MLVAVLVDSQKACVYSWPSVSVAPPERVRVADSRSQYLMLPVLDTGMVPNSTPATESFTVLPACFAASSRNVGLGELWALATAATNRSIAPTSIAILPT